MESGQINDIDVSGLNFALFLDTPPVMSQGDWRVGVYLDGTATDSQAEQLGAVLSGQAGGPPAMLAPLMAAMMLPSVAPTASLYAKTVRSNRTMRIAALVAGYLAVWAAGGVPAFGLAWLASWVTGKHPGAAHVLAVAVFAACGVYQLSRLKDRCLAHCRSPLALLLHYGSYRGRFRDMRAGAHNGAYCLGCCWGLMVILVAVGVMNIAAMIGLAAVVLIEKTWRRGPAAGRAAGAAALALAVAVIWLPWLAPPARRAVDDELTDTSTSPLTEGVTTHPGDDGFPLEVSSTFVAGSHPALNTRIAPTAAEEDVSAEAACENVHNALPRKRHARGYKYRHKRLALCLRHDRMLLAGRGTLVLLVRKRSGEHGPSRCGPARPAYCRYACPTPPHRH